MNTSVKLSKVSTFMVTLLVVFLVAVFFMGFNAYADELTEGMDVETVNVDNASADVNAEEVMPTAAAEVQTLDVCIDADSPETLDLSVLGDGYDGENYFILHLHGYEYLPEDATVTISGFGYASTFTKAELMLRDGMIRCPSVDMLTVTVHNADVDKWYLDTYAEETAMWDAHAIIPTDWLMQVFVNEWVYESDAVRLWGTAVGDHHTDLYMWVDGCGPVTSCLVDPDSFDPTHGPDLDLGLVDLGDLIGLIGNLFPDIDIDISDIADLIGGNLPDIDLGKIIAIIGDLDILPDLDVNVIIDFIKGAIDGNLPSFDISIITDWIKDLLPEIPDFDLDVIIDFIKGLIGGNLPSFDFDLFIDWIKVLLPELPDFDLDVIIDFIKGLIGGGLPSFDLSAIIDWFKGLFPSFDISAIIDWIKGLFPIFGLGTIIIGLLKGLIPSFDLGAIINWIKGLFPSFDLGAIIDWIKGLFPCFDLSAIINWIKGLFSFDFGAIIDWLKGLWDKFWNWIISILFPWIDPTPVDPTPVDPTPVNPDPKPVNPSGNTTPGGSAVQTGDDSSVFLMIMMAISSLLVLLGTYRKREEY